MRPAVIRCALRNVRCLSGSASPRLSPFEREAQHCHHAAFTGHSLVTGHTTCMHALGSISSVRFCRPVCLVI